MIGIAETIRSFVTTRWHSRHRQGRDRFRAWQQSALENWLVHDVPKVDFYASALPTLQDLPVVDKALLMSRFHDFNILKLTADEVRAGFETDFRVHNMTVGASTGTSGHRGLFVISEREKYRWLGSILAKTMPDMILQKSRVAILLPQGGALYESAQKASRIKLAFFSLVEGVESWQHELERFDPTVIVAPPKVLRHLAEAESCISPRRLFAAAETLDPIDQVVIEAYFGGPLEQIYMATEGLLGVTCRHGKLHLAEDSIFFEYEPAGDGLVSPLISSFRRQTQILARYRMNDLLRLSPQQCACGSPLQAVDEIVGRADDCFRFDTVGGEVLITPDVLRNAVLGAGTQINDFRLCQQAKDKVLLRLPPHLEADQAALARTSVENLFKARGVSVSVVLKQEPLPLDLGRKLRRVECQYNAAGHP